MVLTALYAGHELEQTADVTVDEWKIVDFDVRDGLSEGGVT